MKDVPDFATEWEFSTIHTFCTFMRICRLSTLTEPQRTCLCCRHRPTLRILREIRAKLDHFEHELTKLKEATAMLELALWKMKMSENGHQDRATQSQKKMKADESSIRSQDRVTCGADVVIGHVLPFLINTE
jgi:hypothetical protein